jgi:hypothetical protein
MRVYRPRRSMSSTSRREEKGKAKDRASNGAGSQLGIHSFGFELEHSIQDLEFDYGGRLSLGPIQTQGVLRGGEELCQSI